MAGIKETMEKIVDKPTRAQLQANITISGNWIKGVQSGSFPGTMTLHVAALLDFLTKQHDAALAEYERESLTHPEWGTNKPKPEVKEPAAAA